MAFDDILPSEDIDKNVWNVSVLKFRRLDSDVILSCRVIFHLKSNPVRFC